MFIKEICCCLLFVYDVIKVLIFAHLICPAHVSGKWIFVTDILWEWLFLVIQCTCSGGPRNIIGTSSLSSLCHKSVSETSSKCNVTINNHKIKCFYHEVLSETCPSCVFKAWWMWWSLQLPRTFLLHFSTKNKCNSG